jgi:OmpA-OmpF porin, OOP family
MVETGMTRLKATCLSAVLMLPLGFGLANAKDVAGSKDHPLVGRYTGSEISSYKTHAFEEAFLLAAPLDNEGVSAAMAGRDTGPSWRKVEGTLTEIRYDQPEGRSSLEIIRNLRESLTAKGFEVTFACDDAECFSGSQNDPYLLGWTVDSSQQNGRYTGHARYLLAHMTGPRGEVWASVLAGDAGDKASVFVKVVEAKAMDSGQVVFVDAGAMSKALGSQGRVALYGIQFDTGKDVPKPESGRTLDEIASLLKSSPGLKLIVTGHTDNQGAFDFNVDLSRRRAASIVSILTGRYGIGADRLTPFGAGMASPIASNGDDGGRAKNRRVELVER